MDLMTISGKINILDIIKQTDFYEDTGVGGGRAYRIKACHTNHLHSKLSERGLWSLGWDACTGVGSHQSCKNTSSLIKQQPQKSWSKVSGEVKNNICPFGSQPP